jgi:hypothetical protein
MAMILSLAVDEGSAGGITISYLNFPGTLNRTLEVPALGTMLETKQLSANLNPLCPSVDTMHFCAASLKTTLIN